MNRYVVVTAISTYRMRYCVPLDELKDHDGTEHPRWALDLVTCESVKEFSQEHLGEQIVDLHVLDEAEMIEQFDRDNEYLSSWTTDKKIEWVKSWKEDLR